MPSSSTTRSVSDRPHGADRPRAGRRRGPGGLRGGVAGREGAFAQRRVTAASCRPTTLGEPFFRAHPRVSLRGDDTLTDERPIIRIARLTAASCRRAARPTDAGIRPHAVRAAIRDGQIGDVGYIESADERIGIVSRGDRKGEVSAPARSSSISPPSSLRRIGPGAPFRRAVVDAGKRRRRRQTDHTATHLMHAALQAGARQRAKDVEHAPRAGGAVGGRLVTRERDGSSPRRPTAGPFRARSPRLVSHFHGR